MSHALRRLFVALLTAGLVLLGTPALATTTSTTTHEHGITATFEDVVPACSEGGPPYLVTITYNSVDHQTLSDDGGEHDTFTQTGTLVAVPIDDATLPSYTGKFTVWGGFNANGSTVEGTFTFNLRATGSDGSTVSVHSVDHFNVTPHGAEFAFTHCH